MHAFAKSTCPKPVIHFIEHSSHFFSQPTPKQTNKQAKKEKLAAVSFAEAVTVFIVYNEAVPWGLDEEQIDR